MSRAKVAEQRQVATVEEDVGGLDVPVEHAVRVEVVQRPRQLCVGVEHLGLEQRLARLPPSIKQLLEGAMLGVLEHNVEAAAVEVGVDEADDVRVVVEHHKYLHLAQHLRRARRRESLLRNVLAAEQPPVRPAPHNPRCRVRPLPQDVQPVEVGLRASARPDKLGELHPHELLLQHGRPGIT